MQQLKKSNYPSNAFGRFWMKIPLIFRSVILGFSVSSIGVGIWVLMVTTIAPQWSVPVMALVLIFYWRYFSGKWAPSSTQDFRSLCIRQTRLKRPVWTWGLLAALSIFILMHMSWSFIFRLYEFQPEIFKSSSYLNELPAWTSWSIIVMASLVAGICEEVGFRGYMQAPLEKKYGPVVGISITSIIFILVHLHQAWAGGLVAGMVIFGMSFIIGYLAYATKSLLAGIIAHVTFDIINFSYWWSDVIGTFEHKPISMTGVDGHFIFTTVVFFLSIVLFIFSINKLLKLKTKNSSELNLSLAVD